jgi:hypothetical protein
MRGKCRRWSARTSTRSTRGGGPGAAAAGPGAELGGPPPASGAVPASALGAAPAPESGMAPASEPSSGADPPSPAEPPSPAAVPPSSRRPPMSCSFIFVVVLLKEWPPMGRSSTRPGSRVRRDPSAPDLRTRVWGKAAPPTDRVALPDGAVRPCSNWAYIFIKPFPDQTVDSKGI